MVVTVISLNMLCLTISILRTVSVQFQLIFYGSVQRAGHGHDTFDVPCGTTVTLFCSWFCYQGVDLPVKELDSLMHLLSEKKRKAEQEEAETNMEILLEFLHRSRQQKQEELNLVRP